jgi:ABC-type multidrug transport system permease subunit
VKSLWRVLGVAGFYFVWIRRQWMWIIQAILMPLGLIFIVYGWAGVEGVKLIIPIFIVTSMWGFGLNIIGQSVGYDRITREWERIIASQLTLGEYFAGMILGMLPLGLADIAPLVAIAILWRFDIKLILLALVLSPLAMAIGAFFSLAIVLRIKHPMNISAITNPLYFLTTFLSPVFYPSSILPEPVRTGVLAVPTASFAEIIRAFMAELYASRQVYYAGLSILAWLILTAIATKRALKWSLE